MEDMPYSEYSETVTALLQATLALLREDKRFYLLFDKPLWPVKKPEKEKIFTIPNPVPQKSTTSPQIEKKELPIKENVVAIRSSEPKLASLPERKSIKAPLDPFEDLKILLRKTNPEIILSPIPSDYEAKRISQSYLYKNKAEKITVIFSQETPKEKLFLENLAKALDKLLPCKIISIGDLEKRDEWEAFLSNSHLQLLIGCDFSIHEQKNLMKHYKEFPSRSETFLGTVPLFMLPNLSLYFKEPLLKRSLWKALCQKLHQLGLLQSS